MSVMSIRASAFAAGASRWSAPVTRSGPAPRAATRAAAPSRPAVAPSLRMSMGMPLTSMCCTPLGQSGRLAGIRAAPADGSIAAATLGFVTGKRGRFITIEGPDGSGKTTQVERLAERLRAAGRPVVVTREPGGTRLGEQLREILLARHGGVEATDALTDAFLFEAARRHLVRQVIRPALEDEAIVVRPLLRLDIRLPGLRRRGAARNASGARRSGNRRSQPGPDDPAGSARRSGLARVAPDDVTRFEAEHDLAFHRRARRVPAAGRRGARTVRDRRRDPLRGRGGGRGLARRRGLARLRGQ